MAEETGTVGIAVEKPPGCELRVNAQVTAFHRLTAVCALFDVDPRSPAAFELAHRGLMATWINTGEGSHHYPTETRVAQALANIQELGDQQSIVRETGRGMPDEFWQLPDSASGWG